MTGRIPRRAAIVALALVLPAAHARQSATRPLRPPRAAPRFPECPSPPELSPTREFILLRKHFKCAWVPVDRAEPPAGASRTFDDSAWTAAAVPGLPAEVLAARLPGHRLALRRLFEVTASARTHATLALPPLAGPVAAWIDGRRLGVPVLEAVRQEVEIGALAPGIHVLYLEATPAGSHFADPIGGEISVVRSDPCRIGRLSVAASPPLSPANGALVTASWRIQGTAPRDAAIELWRLAGAALEPLDRAVVRASPSMRVPLRVPDPRLWTPATPSIHVLRAILEHEGRAEDDLCAPVPLRGYEFRDEQLVVRGTRHPLLAVRASFAPGPDLPGRAGAALRKWKSLGANAVVVDGPMPAALPWLSDRIGLLAFAALAETGSSGPSLERRAELLDEDLGSHPSFAGFVVPAAAWPPRSPLAVLSIRAFPGEETARPAATGPGLLAVDGLDDAAALRAWLEAREGRATGVVVPGSAARVLALLRRE